MMSVTVANLLKADPLFLLKSIKLLMTSKERGKFYLVMSLSPQSLSS